MAAAQPVVFGQTVPNADGLITGQADISDDLDDDGITKARIVRAPFRGPSFEADVKVPFMRGLIIGISLFLLTMMAGTALWIHQPAWQRPDYGWIVFTALVLLIVPIPCAFVRGNWLVEKIEDVTKWDVNGDGQTGSKGNAQPSARHEEIVINMPAPQRGDGSNLASPVDRWSFDLITYQGLIDLAHGVLNLGETSLARNVWARPKDKDTPSIMSELTYNQVMQFLGSRGYLMGEGATRTITPNGRQFLHNLLEQDDKRQRWG